MNDQNAHTAGYAATTAARFPHPPLDPAQSQILANDGAQPSDHVFIDVSRAKERVQDTWTLAAQLEERLRLVLRPPSSTPDSAERKPALAMCPLSGELCELVVGLDASNARLSDLLRRLHLP